MLDVENGDEKSDDRPTPGSSPVRPPASVCPEKYRTVTPLSLHPPNSSEHWLRCSVLLDSPQSRVMWRLHKITGLRGDKDLNGCPELELQRFSLQLVDIFMMAQGSWLAGQAAVLVVSAPAAGINPTYLSTEASISDQSPRLLPRNDKIWFPISTHSLFFSWIAFQAVITTS